MKCLTHFGVPPPTWRPGALAPCPSLATPLVEEEQVLRMSVMCSVIVSLELSRTPRTRREETLSAPAMSGLANSGKHLFAALQSCFFFLKKKKKKKKELFSAGRSVYVAKQPCVLLCNQAASSGS